MPRSSARTTPLPRPSAWLRLSTFTLFFLALATPLAVFAWHVTEVSTQKQIFVSILLSIVAGLLTYELIPSVAQYNLGADLFGKDLNKPGSKEDKPPIPESLGVVCGTIFIVCTILQQLFTSSQEKLVEYDAALCSICFMTFLGFADDVMELPWRYKLILPTIATLPLLVAYSGGTTIVVPTLLRSFIGATLDLGILYKVYMGLLAVFCTNAINIYAGINGLEAGQSFIIACAVITHNLLELDGAVPQQHLFSIVHMMPFVAVTLGLLIYNWYPSQVFVGDTFTYFAGMTFAVCVILGHFSKTLLVFFIPQIINFLYSIPQLIGIVPCPRHRLPSYDSKTNCLKCVKSHMNLVNLTLWVCGDMTENGLCVLLLWFQVLCCGLGFLVRYKVAGYFYT